MRLSNSALDKYELCPRLYKLHYIDKIRYNRSKSHLILGTALDVACEVYLDKRCSDSALNKYTEIMSDLFESLDKYDFLRKDFDNKFKHDTNTKFDLMDHENIDVAKSVYNKGRFLLNERLIPFINENIVKSFGTQLELYVDDPDGNSIYGKPDLVIEDVDGDIVLVDLKTSGSSYSNRKLVESQQLHLYEFMLSRRPLKDIPKVAKIAYLVLRKDKNRHGEPFPVQYLKCEPNCDITEDVMSRFDDAIDKISRNKFPKTKKKHNCTMQFGSKCIYFDICHGNKSVDDIESLTQKEVK